VIDKHKVQYYYFENELYFMANLTFSTKKYNFEYRFVLFDLFKNEKVVYTIF